MIEPSPRIVFLVTGLVRAGSETQVVRLATSFSRRGWSVSVVSMLTPRDYTDELAGAGVAVSSLHLPRGAIRPAAFVQFFRFLRRVRPQVLVSFMFHANLLARATGRMARVPIIINSVRSSNIGSKSRYRLLALTDALSDATTTNSEIVANELAARGVVPKEKLFVTPNAIAESPAAMAPDERARIRDEIGVGTEFFWIAVGRADASKDYPTLLHAVKRVVDCAPQACVLRIAGDTEPLGEDLKRLVRSLELMEHVQFLGLRRDVNALLAAADGYVLSSSVEGLPNALMEALAAGLPSVATAVGGVPEIIDHGRTGLLVSPGSARELATALMQVQEMSAEDRRSLGAAGRKYVAANFSIDGITDRWEGLIQKLRDRRTGDLR